MAEVKFKGFKQVLYADYSAKTTEQKLGYIWFTRPDTASTKGDIWFGSRHYGNYDNEETKTDLAALITNIGLKKDSSGNLVIDTTRLTGSIVSGSTDIADALNDLNTAIDVLGSEVANRTVQTISGANGTARILNEGDGGGIFFAHNNGLETFIGAHDGGGKTTDGENAFGAQIYVDKSVAGQWVGSLMNFYNDKFTYISEAVRGKISKNDASREIAVVGDVNTRRVMQAIDAYKDANGNVVTDLDLMVIPGVYFVGNGMTHMPTDVTAGILLVTRRGQFLISGIGDTAGKTFYRDPGMDDPTTYAGKVWAASAMMTDITVDGISTDEKIISLEDKKLKSTLTIGYDSTRRFIQLKGINNALVSEFDASAFIKDGMLYDQVVSAATAEVMEVTFPKGDKNTYSALTSGHTYIFLEFNNDGEKSFDKLDATTLVDVYTAGHGLQLDGREFSIKIDNTRAHGLSVDEHGLKLAQSDNHTTGAMSATQAAKLSNIESGAQVNILEGVKVNGADLTITNKKVDVLIATGDADGRIKVNGVDVAVQGYDTLITVTGTDVEEENK